jgi:hypothetical protein
MHHELGEIENSKSKITKQCDFRERDEALVWPTQFQKFSRAWREAGENLLYFCCEGMRPITFANA